MSYKVAAGAMPGIEPRMGEREHISLWQDVVWQRVAAFSALGALLLLVTLLTALGSSPLLPVLLVAALLVTTLALLRPAFAVLLVFAGAAFPGLIITLSFHTIRPVEPALGLCLLIVFLRRPAMRLRLPHLLALLFFGIGVISFLHVPNVSTDINVDGADKVLYLLTLYLLAFFTGTFLVEYIKDISSFLVAILLCNIPIYLTGLAQALGLHVFSFLDGTGGLGLQQSGGRLVGPYAGPATFGIYLVNILAIALVCWLLGARRRDRVIGALMTIATILEIIGSGTRSAGVAAVVIVIIALVVTRRYKLLFGTLVFSGVSFILLLGKILPKFLHSDNSVLSRLFVWQQALSLIHAHPWLGIGLEQFPVYYAQLIVPRAQQLDPNGTSVHNQYLDWALSSGVFWPLVAVALLLSILYYCVKAYRGAQREQKALLLATALAVLATLMIGFVDVPLVKTEGGVFLFLLAGLALGHVERILRGNPTTRGVSVARADSPTGLENALYLPAPARRRSYRTPPPVAAQPAIDGVEEQEETPSAQKAGRAVVLQLLSWGISAAIIFPATALLTRYLGPVRYGEYSFTIPFLSIFALFSGTGMDPLLIRMLSTQKRAKWSDTLSFAAGTRLLSTLLMSGSAAFIAFVLPVSMEQRVLLLLGSGSLLFSFSFNGLRTVYECGFWAEQRFAVLSLIDAIDRVVTSALIVVAILLRLSLAWTYILIVYSDLPFALVLVALAGRRFHMKLRFSVARIREHLLGSLSLTIHNALSLFANQANLLLLLPLAGSFSVGLYGLALRITTPLQTIAVMYVIGLYPLLCKEFAEGRARFSAVYSETMRILALAIFPLAIFVSMEAHDIVVLLGGNRFAAASSATQILMWAVMITFFSQLAVRGCMAAKLERSIPWVTGIGVAVNVPTNLLLIPHFQATGAALAALLSQLVAFLLFTALLARHVDLLRAASTVLRVALGNLPALAFLLWQPHLSLVARLPLFVALVVAGCIVTRTFSLRDIALARQMLFARGKTTRSAQGETGYQLHLVVPEVDEVINLPNH